MKVAVYLRDEFTEADREQMAIVIDGARLDRLATRDEIKEFYQTHGLGWRAILDRQFSDFIQEDLEDLI